MNLSIINCSIHHQETDKTTSFLAMHTPAAYHTQKITLEPFKNMFDGTYITSANATQDQKDIITIIQNSEIILFVCPSYYKTMPGIVKNFFDIVRIANLYTDKIIGFVASSPKNQDFGARDVMLAVGAIIEFNKTQATIIQEIPILNPENLDLSATKGVFDLIDRYI